VPAELTLLYLHPFRFPSEHAHSIQILHTCRALAERGVRVRLPVKRNREAPAATLAEGLARYGLAPHPGLQLEWLPTTHKGIAGLAARWKTLRARGERLVFYARHLRLAVTAARNARGPLVVELHRFEEKARQAAQAADALVAITRPLRDQLVESFGLKIPTVVIPDAVDLDRFQPPHEAGPPRLVYIGQLQEWKGVDVLIRALAALPEVSALVVGGRPGEDPRRDALQALALREGVADRIEWTGFLRQADIAPRLRRGDVGVVPTRRDEGQNVAASPLKLFEYMAAGLPVVASDMPSLRDVIRSGENGVLFPEGNPGALAQQVRPLLEPATYARLSAASRAEAKGHTWSDRARRILEVVEPLVSSRSHRSR
jgi:glycosyltransferase involved in cell wall biosynthesis